MKINNREVGIITTCPLCGHVNEIEVNEMDYLDWQDGMTAQKAFPYLPPEEREMLISGICSRCWEKTFNHEEENNEAFFDFCENNFNLEMGFNPYERCYNYDC